MRQGTEEQRSSTLLSEGEPFFVPETGSMWVGDGVTFGGLRLGGEPKMSGRLPKWGCPIERAKVTLMYWLIVTASMLMFTLTYRGFIVGAMFSAAFLLRQEWNLEHLEEAKHRRKNERGET